MSNETVIIHETSIPIPFTCADGTGIAKGAILKLTDPRTAIINSAINDTPAGIAAEEKIANDGKTKIGVYRGGIHKVKCSGSIAVGAPVGISATSNVVYEVPVAVPPYQVLGTALEAATNGETLLIELHPNRGGKQVS